MSGPLPRFGSAADAVTPYQRAMYHTAASVYREIQDLPAAGYVVYFGGEPCGWTRWVEEPNGWLAGCVAVPVDPAQPMRIARGGNYQDGAERWEVMAR